MLLCREASPRIAVRAVASFKSVCCFGVITQTVRLQENVSSGSFCFSTREDACKCGHPKTDHVEEAIKPDNFTGESWNKDRHVREVPTDAFGDISFGGSGQKTGKVTPSFFYDDITCECVPACFQTGLRICPAFPVCTGVHRHKTGNPVPVTDRTVEPFPSQPADLSDRRSQELLSQTSSQEHVPQRSHQSGPDNR